MYAFSSTRFATYQELLEAAKTPLPAVNPGTAALLQPPTPIFKGENWPLLAVGKSMLADLASGGSGGVKGVSAADDDDDFHEAGGGGGGGGGGQWGDDDDDLFDDDEDGGGKKKKGKDAAAGEDGGEKKKVRLRMRLRLLFPPSMCFLVPMPIY